MNFNEHQKGLSAALFCFIFWGFAPIYFKLIQVVPALSIIAHRIIWSALFLFLFLALRERKNLFNSLKLPLRQIGFLFISGTLIISNWLMFVWAVNHELILATSLGYFINPLINILFGVLFLSESLNRAQKIGLIIAASTTIYLGVYIGEPPWIALFLAVTFGLYGFLRKKLQVRPLIGLMWETMLLIIPAAIYLLYFAPQIEASINTLELKTLIVLSGIITLLPLIGFNYAAKRLTLTLVGFLQYIAPTISFLIAVLFYGEEFTFGHKIAFSGIWLALLIVSWAPFLRLFKEPLTNKKTNSSN
jgi:chloramphenicol-sensitive protein RarD